MTKTVLITGGTGLIGKRMSEMLTQKGYQVRVFSRKENLKAVYPAYSWNPSTGDYDERALEGIDGIINLAGAGVADKRWTWSRKKEIIDSRVQSLNLLHEAVSKMKDKPKVLVTASAIGFYGNTGEAICTEDNVFQKDDFLAETCREWENAALPMGDLGIRTCILRVGIVLAKEGGALAKMLPSYKVNVGAYFGDGSMIYSWIHIDDICRQFIHLFENESCNGIYNGVAPNPVTNKTLAAEIGHALHKKVLLSPVPEFLLKIGMGEMASIVLYGCKVSADKIQKSGFVYEYPELKSALDEIL